MSVLPLVAMAALALGDVNGAVTVYPAPAGEPASADYAVRVNGQPVFCYTSFRFDLGSKQTIAGRPVSPVSFASFDFAGSVEVTVELLGALRGAGIDTSQVVIRPLAHGLRPEVRDGAVTFRLDRPCQLSIEPGGGTQHPLHLFANPPDGNLPDRRDPNVIWFEPGRHELDATQLRSGQTVYLAGGSIVSLKPVTPDRLSGPHGLYGLALRNSPGLFDATRQRDVTIRGRGILCGRAALAEGQRGPLLKFHTCRQVRVEGIIIRESSVWSLNFVNCQDVQVRNVKVLGHYVNNDGIVVGGTSDALVEDCFCHNADDSLEVKVWIPQQNVTFRRCVVWNDVGGALGLCCETGADLRGVRYEDCTVIHALCTSTSRGAIGLELEGTGSVRDFAFRNIVIEDVVGPRHAPIKVVNNWDDWHMGLPTKPGCPYEQASPPKRAAPRGGIRDVRFENVRVLRSENQDVVLMADGPASPIENVTFDAVEVNGTRLRPGDPRLRQNAGVRSVQVR